MIARRDVEVSDHIAGATTPAATTNSVVARQEDEHGGVKVGSAFFGWLTATGAAVLLTALLSAAGTAIGISTVDNVADTAAAAGDNVETIGTAGAILVLLILFIAYYCGGYVAGRMARFKGAIQGVAVWVWAIVIAVVVAVLGVVAGSQYDVLSQLNAFPRIPLSEGDITTAGVIALVLAALVALAGAVLGGMAGMRFHRRVDRTTEPAR